MPSYREVALALAATFLTTLPALAQKRDAKPGVPPYYGPQPATEELDLSMYARIREEGLKHSHVMEFAGALSDDIGPRLTGSPNMARANAWTRDTLTALGLSNAHLEDWGDFGMGWQQINTWARMVSPDPEPLLAPGRAVVPRHQGPRHRRDRLHRPRHRRRLPRAKRHPLRQDHPPRRHPPHPGHYRASLPPLHRRRTQRDGVRPDPRSRPRRRAQSDHPSNSRPNEPAPAGPAQRSPQGHLRGKPRRHHHPHPRRPRRRRHRHHPGRQRSQPRPQRPDPRANAVTIPNAVMMIEHYNRLARLAHATTSPSRSKSTSKPSSPATTSTALTPSLRSPAPTPELKSQVVMVGGHLDSLDLRHRSHRQRSRLHRRHGSHAHP